MGGLMASAAGALSNCAAVRARRGPGGRCEGMSVAGTSSMAEWQISQAEQAPECWGCAAQLAGVLSQVAAVAVAAWS